MLPFMQEDSRVVPLGDIVLRDDIRSSEGPFQALLDYRVVYPAVVVKALGELYLEYNRAFGPLLVENREWETDYLHCFSSGVPANYMVQIDMVGLDAAILRELALLPLQEVRERLRGLIFEIENSLAMYQLLERCFSQDGCDTFFRKRFRAALDTLRQKTGMPVALLAVTREKLAAMKQAEFGRAPLESITDSEVRELSGFDHLFGPDEFEEHLAANGGESQYLLYARTSDPVEKLRRPAISIDHPLLGKPHVRRAIKRSAITLNVDNPDWLVGDPRRVNDTKAYQPPMGMGFEIVGQDDLFSQEFLKHLSRGGAYRDYAGVRLASGFVSHLLRQGMGIDAAVQGDVTFRAKPLQGTYGCYGHVVGNLAEAKFRQELKRNLSQRGRYLLQPELPVPRLRNQTDGQEYAYIDRNFFACSGGTPEFLGGMRNFLPVDSQEVTRGRVHGNRAAVWAEIVPG